jgi:hypothetical protein
MRDLLERKTDDSLFGSFFDQKSRTWMWQQSSFADFFLFSII